MNDYIWVIKVTFPNKEVNFNEGYKTLQECLNSIRKKINNYEDMYIINEFTIKDLDSEIIYEAKCVTIK